MKVTGSEKAPVPAFASPLPSMIDPCHSTSACRSNAAIDVPPVEFLSSFPDRDAKLDHRTDHTEGQPTNERHTIPRNSARRIQDPDVGRRGQPWRLRTAGQHQPTENHRPGAPEGGSEDD